jgi:hypothetical protein
VLDRINVKFGMNALHSGRMLIDATRAMNPEVIIKRHNKRRAVHALHSNLAFPDIDAMRVFLGEMTAYCLACLVT